MGDDSRSAGRSKVWLTAVFLALVGLSAAYLWWTVQRVERRIRDGLLQQAQLIAAVINWDRLDALSGTEGDLGAPEYEQLKAQLAQTRSIIPKCRFLYLMGQNDGGEIFFYVDSEPAGSEDESPPGQIYEEATEAAIRVFTEGSASVQGPYPDRWGVWISAFVPIHNPRTGDVAAALGMDIDASDWRALRRSNLIVPILFSVTIAGIYWVGVALFVWRKRFAPEQTRTWLARHAEVVMAAGVCCWLTPFIAYESHDREQQSHAETFAQLSVERAVAVLDAIRELRDSQLEGLAQFFASSEVVDRQEFHAYSHHLTKNPVVYAWSWAPAVPAEARSSLEETVRRDGLADFGIWEKNAFGEARPAATREMYFPVLYIAPVTGNEAVFGFDLASDPLRRAAMEQAAQTGFAAATEPLVLVHESGNRANIVVFQPVFADDALSQLKGFVNVVLRLQQIFAQTVPLSDYRQPTVMLDLYQLNPDAPPLFLASSQSDHAKPYRFLHLEVHDFFTELVTVAPLYAFGRAYIITAHPGPAFHAIHPARAALTSTAVGTLLSALLVAFVALLNNRRYFLEQQMRERTAALGESEARYRLLFEGSHDALMTLEPPDWRFTSCNAATLALFGARDQAEFTTFTLWGLCPDRQPDGSPSEAKAREMLEIALREGSHYFEWTHRRINGETFPCTVLLHKMTLEDRTILEATVRDMTEYKRAQDAVIESETRLNKLIDVAQDAIIMMDADGNISMWNASAERIFGYAATEALGHDLHKLLAPERFWDAFQAGFTEFQKTGTGNAVGQVLELTALRKSGEEFPVEFSLSAVQLQERWHAIGILRDISARKQAEAALQETLHHLEEATARANEMAVKAEIANLAKSQFLANMSHEIRTPMNGVIGAIDLLLDTDLNNEQRHFAEIVRSSGESLLTLIDDILDYSKIEAGKLDLETLDFDLRALLDDFAAMLAMRAQDKGLEFVCAADPQIPTHLQGDPGRLRQVLLNLAGNAIKFTHRGEVSVRAYLESETETEAVLRFSIKDTGIGIPDTKIDILFDKFTQVDASTTRKYGGTGLGLAISKQLVEMMGGQIGVSSKEGVGSEFWFTARFLKQPKPKRIEAPPVALRGAHVLVVDDNATNREIISVQCAAWGVRAEQTCDGPTALRMLHQARETGDPFAVVIIDMQMPEMDGETLGQAIKADKSLKDTLMVMMTSFGRRGDTRRLEAIGFSGYLTKPVRQSDLFDCLAMTLAGAKQEEKTQAIVTRHAIREMRRGAARILLAEDNITNQQVALGLLRRLGFYADTVFNGKDALHALEQRDYDLVLMDVQMPVMDGLEATRRIRDPRSPVRNHAIPIIAMTAHVMKGDREKCLHAGMDDYIAKPIDPKVLADTLGRFLSQEERAESIAQPCENVVQQSEKDQSAKTTAAPVFDKEALMGRLMGDRELAQVVTTSFIQDMPRRITALKASLAAGNLESAIRETHTIKGSSANVGGEALRHAAAEMEQAGKSGDIAAMTAWMATLEKQFELLKEAMEDEFS